jgi:ERCC4-related helicase
MVQQSSITFKEIVTKAQKLSFEELTAFSKKIMQIQAERMVDDLPLEEVLLLEKIRKQLPFELQERFKILKEKRLDETLSEIEHKEYLEIIEVIEMDNAEKVKHVGAFALLRNRPILELGKELGIFNHG